MCTPSGYKCLPYGLAFMSLIEMLLGLIRVFIFFGRKPPSNVSFFEYINIPPEEFVKSPFLLRRQGQVAFIIDWIASAIPTLMGIYVLLFIMILLIITIITALTICIWPTCICMLLCAKQVGRSCTYLCLTMGSMCTNKANHRFVSLACNCPWYIARPQWRF